MKTLITLSTVALIFSAVQAQEKTSTSAPVALPMTAPAMKTQNTQQSSQNSTAPKSTGTTADPTKKSAGDKKEEAAPPVDNKIAVSDPGVPADKSSKKSAGSTQSSEKKTATTGVSPK